MGLDAELRVTSHANDFAARVTGIDLSRPLSVDNLQHIRSAWHRHQVLYFPDQPLTHAQLEAFSRSIGPFGTDPFIAPVAGHQHILEIRREAEESVAPFGASWHSDWSFQPSPPSATILHAKVVPPVGGDTWFADGIRAYEALDAHLKHEIESLKAIHSARRPYSPEGFRRSGGDQRSMDIVPSEAAWATQTHPLVRIHAHSGRRALWINPVYTIGIEGMPTRESEELLQRLFDHALQPRFIYQHRWAPDMLTMWDNRTVQHCATGGYDGYRRVLHRTVVAGEIPCPVGQAN